MNNLGAQARAGSWDAIRFGAGVEVSALKATLNAGDSFNFGFYLCNKDKLTDGQYLGVDRLQKKVQLVTDFTWTEECENMTTAELVEALRAAGVTVFGSSGDTIIFSVIVSGVNAQSEGYELVFRPYIDLTVDSESTTLYSAQLYNSVLRIKNWYVNGEGDGKSIAYPA